MKEESLLVEYIKMTFAEGGYIRAWGKKNSIFRKLSRIFGDERINSDITQSLERDARGITKSWLHALSKSRSLDLTKEFKTEVLDFAVSEWDKIMFLAENDIENARVILKRKLNSRFARKIDKLEIIQNNIDNEL